MADARTSKPPNAHDPDTIATAKSLPLRLRCEDCAADIGECTLCRACSETRRLLPRYLSLVRGRALVRKMLSELDELDALADSAR